MVVYGIVVLMLTMHIKNGGGGGAIVVVYGIVVLMLTMHIKITLRLLLKTGTHFSEF